MSFLPEVCLGPRNNRVDFEDDPVSRIYMKLLQAVCIRPTTNPLHFGDDPEFAVSD